MKGTTTSAVQPRVETVVRSQAGIPAHLLGRDPLGFPVVAGGPQVEALPVVEQPDLGALGGGLALLRLPLEKSIRRHRPAPHRIIEAAVEDRGLSRVDPYSFHRP
jgi:hypothetical protein